MASDLDLLVGIWTVHVKKWTWEYDFIAGGKVNWRDVNSPEKGNGYWAATSKLVNIVWNKSTTRESWQRPLTPANDHTWYQSTYFAGKYKIEKRLTAPAPPAPAPTQLTDQMKIDQGYTASRDSLRFAGNRLRSLQTQLANLDAPNTSAEAVNRVKQEFKRDIAVIALRLVVSSDPQSRAFRDALGQVLSKIEQNLPLPKSLFAARDARKCRNPKSAFAWTSIGQRPPDTDLCTSWFNANADLRRDVITHEYFHTIGAEDISVNTTAEALRNANTLAQVVAFINDRSRQVQSDGHERASPPLPMP